MREFGPLWLTTRSKEYQERRSSLTKEIRKAMEMQKIASNSGDIAGDLDAQGKINDLMARVNELDRKFRQV